MQTLGLLDFSLPKCMTFCYNVSVIQAVLCYGTFSTLLAPELVHGQIFRVWRT